MKGNYNAQKHFQAFNVSRTLLIYESITTATLYINSLVVEISFLEVNITQRTGPGATSAALLWVIVLEYHPYIYITYNI